MLWCVQTHKWNAHWPPLVYQNTFLSFLSNDVSFISVCHLVFVEYVFESAQIICVHPVYWRRIGAPQILF
jgi:hypothetical protein